MKCHWCHQELQIYETSPDTYIVISRCPDDHISLTNNNNNNNNNNNKIIGYTIIWDADIRAHERYRLRYNGSSTVLSIQEKNNFKYYSAPYRTIVSVDKKIDLLIEDDIVQGERMINSLKKLRVFA